MLKFIGLACVSITMSQAAAAGPCDHVPSKLFGKATTSSVATGTGAVAAAGIGMQAAGLYSITNAATGAAMLGSTAAGTSAAGTVGILSGTAGVVGTVGAALLSPFVLIPAAVVTVGVAGYEGLCYFAKTE